MSLSRYLLRFRRGRGQPRIRPQTNGPCQRWSFRARLTKGPAATCVTCHADAEEFRQSSLPRKSVLLLIRSPCAFIWLVVDPRHEAFAAP